MSSLLDKHLWMAVTPDEYELPLAVEDTARELGNRFNVDANVVMSCVKKERTGKNTGRKFIKVEIREDD